MNGPERRSPVVAFLAWLLMVAGGLIFTTAGACSLIFGFALMPAGSKPYLGDLGDMVLMVLTFGGVPFVIGLALFLGGLRLNRPLRKRTPTPPATERDDEPRTGA